MGAVELPMTFGVDTFASLGASRFDVKYGMPGLAHDPVMRTIELYGTQVVPLARELLAESVRS